LALQNKGVGIAGIGFAALGCGIAAVLPLVKSARIYPSRMAWPYRKRLGEDCSNRCSLWSAAAEPVWCLYANVVEIAISGLGCFFAGAAVVISAAAYRNDQYLPAALSMY